MNMYAMLFGQNEAAEAILATLGLTQASEDVGRFRDCFVADGEIAVYTRNGGGNREAYEKVFEKLREHPCYLRDEDDDFDATYATIYFSFPEEWRELLEPLDAGEPFDPSKRWAEAIETLKAMKAKG